MSKHVQQWRKNFTVYRGNRTALIFIYFFLYCNIPPVSKLSGNKVKGKGHPITRHEVPEGEKKYSFNPPSTSAVDGGG
jgi:hypothetical protein